MFNISFKPAARVFNALSALVFFSFFTGIAPIILYFVYRGNDRFAVQAQELLIMGIVLLAHFLYLIVKSAWEVNRTRIKYPR